MSEMNRRGDDRIEMQLPCRVLFPGVWFGSLDGLTGNLHRNGVIVACHVNLESELPSLGATATVHIELPANRDFSPRYMRCDTTLLRIEELGDRDFQFAMKILNIDIQDVFLADLNSETSSYVM